MPAQNRSAESGWGMRRAHSIGSGRRVRTNTRIWPCQRDSTRAFNDCMTPGQAHSQTCQPDRATNNALITALSWAHGLPDAAHASPQHDRRYPSNSQSTSTQSINYCHSKYPPHLLPPFHVPSPMRFVSSRHQCARASFHAFLLRYPTLFTMDEPASRIVSTRLPCVDLSKEDVDDL